MFSLKSQIAIKILGFYFLNNNAKKYLNELSRILKADAGNLDKKLKELEKEGILLSETAGKERYYFLNKKYPLLKETKKIYELKYGLEVNLLRALKNSKEIKEAYIFGSYAKGNFDPGSDVDILLIGSHSSIEAKKRILELQNRLNREFNIIDLTEKEYLKLKKGKDDFIKNIFKEKIIKII
ncbi:nucleotidyltransferase domain-containing protein [Candidatus Parcubacteria bacterium]|nr:nucleotidyltransferase domain-containing protein [Candidatus Parcubacteria bacterium]